MKRLVMIRGGGEMATGVALALHTAGFRTTMILAEVTSARGPGFCAGRDVDTVIDTTRGHNMGRIVHEGFTRRDDEELAPYETIEHIVFASAAGRFEALRSISFLVRKGEVIGHIHAGGGTVDVTAPFDGVLRGILRDGTTVYEGEKVADVHPEMTQGECFTVSDKVRCIGGSVLTDIMQWESGHHKRLRALLPM